MIAVSSNSMPTLIPVDESIEDEIQNIIENQDQRGRKRQIGGGRQKKTCLVKCEDPKAQTKKRKRKYTKKLSSKSPQTKPKKKRKSVGKARKLKKKTVAKPKNKKPRSVKRKVKTSRKKKSSTLF